MAAVPAPVVQIAGLWTVFGKGEQAFSVHQDLDLTVQRGEILALVGGSGTGKTVLLRQMLGLMQPARGSVTVLGRPAREMTGEGAASRVGMLFQHGAQLSAFNVLDNIAFALSRRRTLPAYSPQGSISVSSESCSNCGVKASMMCCGSGHSRVSLMTPNCTPPP